MPTDHSNIPIIALSAHALAGERENALAAGCNEFDTNPIEFSRYTHRVAISNRRLIAANASGVTFKYKDYRIKGPGRYKTMTLATHEFIRRFLLHVRPKGFHRIRHYGLFASTCRAENIARARELLATAAPTIETAPDNAEADKCPCCGGRMVIIETFERGSHPRYRASTPTATIRVDTS